MVNVGSLGTLHCQAAGKPIPTVQWFKEGVAVNPLPSPFQQALLVPTGTPHTTVYTCIGVNHAGNNKHTSSANIIMIVKGIAI